MEESVPKTPKAMAEHITYILDLLEEQGKGDYLGESISQLEHCLQAAYFATEEVDDEEAIIAALLHDIGQFLPLSELKVCSSARSMIDQDMGANVGRHGHDVLGQRWLLLHGWPKKVADLVGAHVTAKRLVLALHTYLPSFLTATQPQYLASLSNASQASLRMQGGPFTPEQVEEFKTNPSHKEMVMLRLWDDRAKIVGLKTPPLDYYRPMAERVLQRAMLVSA